MPGARILTAVVIAVVLAGLASRASAHQSGGADTDRSNGSIGAWVGAGGSDGGSWHHKGSGVACTYVVPPGAPDEIIRDFDGVTNFLYFRECTDGTLDPVWVPQLSGRDLATLASDEIHKRLPVPTVGLAPAADRGVVQVGTWIWTDPATWQPVTATASIPGLAATVTARPLRLRFDPGDGVYGTGPITCDGPGQEWRPEYGDERPSSCMYTYRHASSLAPSGRWSASMSIDWAVTFAVSDGSSGSLGTLTTSASRALAVGEVEALVVRPG